MGFYHGWGWSWPLNRRVLYNRASADLDGKAWDPARPGIQWDGEDQIGRRVASGIYYYQLRAGSINLTRRMVLLR